MYYLIDVILFFFFFFKQKTAYEMLRSLVGSEMCIRDRLMGEAVEQEDDGIPAFKLSMFNEAEATTQDVDYGAGTEVESMKLTVKTNRKQANKELGDIMSGFDGAAQGEQDGDDEDDLLSLMDNA
eukprot:TRINITY_DN23559_c0_g1_i5.p1 TRINITY_DN23559_c0_g1~~TRINITY_DN23559_c0_g1_i5.p1  ORF type:complete len:125 (+),score=56.17 TRINITY_DN23559_c0_g1_i5:50-424(+)